MLKKYGLTRKEKIVSSFDFERIKLNNKKIETAHFIILTDSNNLNIPRIGIIVSKKIGNAVKRNRIKRLIRTFFRLNKHRLENVDYVFIPKKNINTFNYNDIERELAKVLCIK